MLPPVLRHPPIRPRPSQDEFTRRLESLGLLLNSPEPAIICRSCRFALAPSEHRISRHLAEKHNVPKLARHGLSDCIRALNLPDPGKLCLRPDGSPPHPHLLLQRGAVCEYCNYRTTSFELIRRHLARSHGKKQGSLGSMADCPTSECFLQGWTKNGARTLWIVNADGIPASPNSNTNVSHETATLRRSRIEELHHTERDRLANERSATAVTETGGEDISLISNWMRRTGWIEMFAEANRALLARLTELPYSSESGLYLGTYEGVELYSCYDDEKRLARVVTALGSIFDRCEDTARHTDTSIRCWLRSQWLDRPYKAPFELVGRKSTTRQYRRLMERFVCFCFRLWRLEARVRDRLLKRSPTKDQCEQLVQVWSHKLWSTCDGNNTTMSQVVSSAQAQTDEPDSHWDCNWDCKDTAWSSSDDEFEDESESESESESDIDTPTESSMGHVLEKMSSAITLENGTEHERGFGSGPSDFDTSSIGQPGEI